MTPSDQAGRPPGDNASTGRRAPRKSDIRRPFRGQRSGGLQSVRTPDYLIVGHITADLEPDGSVILGGTALYSGIAAANLGARVAILTRGVFGTEVAGMKVPGLDEYADQLQIVVQDAEVPTTFVNTYLPGRREQTIPHWAGPIDLRGLPPHWRNAKVVHLGPVADEIDPRGIVGMHAGFLGVTPQGWMREWPRQRGGKVRQVPLRLPVDLTNRIDCAIVSDEEIFQARDVIERVGSRRLSVVTRGPAGARVYFNNRDVEEPGEGPAFKTIDIPGVDVRVKSLSGAGDVFAAAFFLKASDRTTSALNAAEFATVVASLSLREIGVGSVPPRDEVARVLERRARSQAR